MEETMEPVIRHGLLGLCALQLAVGMWLLRLVLAMAKDMTAVVESNTAAVKALAARGLEWSQLAHDLRDRILTRPCMAGRAEFFDRRKVAAGRTA